MKKVQILYIYILLDDKKELKTEFLKLVSKFIHFELINWNIILSESITELEDVNFVMNLKEIKEKRNHYSINLSKMNDEVKEIIIKYFIDEERLIIEERDLEILGKNNINEIIDMLLENENVKINIIGLLIIIHTNINYKCILLYK